VKRYNFYHLKTVVVYHYQLSASFEHVLNPLGVSAVGNGDVAVFKKMKSKGKKDKIGDLTSALSHMHTSTRQAIRRLRERR
jgi:hypothetical protein